MPLKEGKSKKVFDSNMTELMAAFTAKGKIGNTTPKSKAHARRMALAISFDQKKPKKGK